MRYQREVHTVDREGEFNVSGIPGTRTRERESTSRTTLDVLSSIQFKIVHAKWLFAGVFLTGIVIGTFVGRPALDFSLNLLFG